MTWLVLQLSTFECPNKNSKHMQGNVTVSKTKILGIEMFGKQPLHYKLLIKVI